MVHVIGALLSARSGAFHYAERVNSSLPLE